MTTSRTYDAKRRAEKPSRAWYKSKAWKIRKAQQRAEHPTCCLCERDGIVRLMSIVDHHPRHNEDYRQFFEGPLRSLCKPHHDSEAQADEARGFSTEIGDDGWPIDSAHPMVSGAPSRKGAPGPKPFGRPAVAGRSPPPPGAPSPRLGARPRRG